MKNLQIFMPAVIAGLLLTFCSPKSAEEEITNLFQEGSDDWLKVGNASWGFENDELVAKLDSGMGFVQTKASFADFELTLEFMPDSTINSGVYVRCGTEGITPDFCYEINIWDLHPNQEFRTGSVVTKAKPLAYVETLNKWNTYRIKCEGGRVKAWVNGTLTADLEDVDFSIGQIALQAAQRGSIRFRNVQIK